MKPGAILNEREAKQMLHRLSRMSTLTNDRRIKEHCRLGTLTIKAAAKRAAKYNSEQVGTQLQLF